MSERSLIFDDNGAAWPLYGPQLASHLGCDLGGEALSAYAVRNLGFIALMQGRRGTEIRLREGKASEVALAGLLYWLSDHPQDRVVLSSLKAAWAHEMFSAFAPLRRRLEQLVDFSPLSKGQRFFLQDVSPDALAPGGPLKDIHAAWAAGSLTSRESVAQICDRLFAGRFTIVRVADDEQLIIENAGCGYACYDNTYIDKASGSRLEDEPDWQYGRWIAMAHLDVAQSGRAVVQNVDADIGPIADTRQRFLYRRVLLPFTEGDGNTFVVTASLPEPGLDLRACVG